MSFQRNIGEADLLLLYFYRLCFVFNTVIPASTDRLAFTDTIKRQNIFITDTYC